MRLAALLLAAVALAGCLGAPPPSPPSCPLPEGGPLREGRHVVEVQVANEMAQATCVRVRFGDDLVAAAQLPAEHPALHATPGTVATLTWDAATVEVRVEDAATGRTHREPVALGERTWVVVRVDEGGIRVQAYDREPLWA